MVIGAYIRTSKDELNPENQKFAIEKYCFKKGWKEICWYEDCLSGLADKRPAHEALIGDVRHGRIDTVIFFSLSRFERRGILPTLLVLNEFDRRNVPFISLTEPIDTLEGPYKELIIAFLAALYNIEVLQISERTKAGLARAKRDGKTLGRPKKESKRGS
jgi:DNA invertase Pin-like site-specific DNA recombinase